MVAICQRQSPRRPGFALVSHTPVLYRLFACSIVLNLVRRWIIGCRDCMGVRGTVGRSCLGCMALLA